MATTLPLGLKPLVQVDNLLKYLLDAFEGLIKRYYNKKNKKSKNNKAIPRTALLAAEK